MSLWSFLTNHFNVCVTHLDAFESWITQIAYMINGGVIFQIRKKIERILLVSLQKPNLCNTIFPEPSYSLPEHVYYAFSLHFFMCTYSCVLKLNQDSSFLYSLQQQLCVCVSEVVSSVHDLSWHSEIERGILAGNLFCVWSGHASFSFNVSYG